MADSKPALPVAREPQGETLTAHQVAVMWDVFNALRHQRDVESEADRARGGIGGENMAAFGERLELGRQAVRRILADPSLSDADELLRVLTAERQILGEER